jgi:tRNA pseudouridine38-40 synthase
MPLKERNLKLVLEYDGTRYSGWQLQKNAPTVQGVVEESLRRLLDHPVRVTGGSRTDSGVHALGQVANFRTTTRLSPDQIRRGLNALLPADVAAREAAEAPAEFNARRAAMGKLYAYRILNREERSAFERGYAWHLREPLDLEAMRRAGGDFLGRHDFSAFRASSCQAQDPVRVVRRLEVKAPGDDRITIEIEGTAFLQHMARTMVGTLVEIGQGKRPPEGVAGLLESGERTLAGPTAPAQGLYLVRIFYEEAR